MELLAEELAKAPILLPRDVDLGSMASPRIAQWAEQGVYIIARPWPHIGPLFTKQDFTLDFARMQGTCPGGQHVPMVPGRHVQLPAAACEAYALRAQCSKATYGYGRGLSIREDEPFQHKLRTKMQTQRERLPCANAPQLNRRSPISWCTKDGAPVTRGYAKISLTVGVMPPAATSKWRLIMRRNVDLPLEVAKV